MEQALNDLWDEPGLLIHASGLDRTRIAELQKYAQQQKRSLFEVVMERGGISENLLLQNLAQLMQISYLGDKNKKIPDEVVGQISPALAIRYGAIPLLDQDNTLSVAWRNPFDWQSWDEFAYLIRRPVAKVLCPSEVIDYLIKRHYGLGADTVERLVSQRGQMDLKFHDQDSTNLSEQESANEPTVVNLVNRILGEAIRLNATDIHFEPHEDKYRIRYRIDGILEDVSIPASVNLLKAAVVSRIKIMSHLDITEKRLPQDGRSRVSLNGQEYDLRLSVLPGIYGEAVMIRLQCRQMIRLDLEDLGFAGQEKDKIASLIQHPHGLMLVTGPTGSGKTTTLYTSLSRINTSDSKIITIEDPVEYWMDNILQMQVHEQIGFTFARALRGILRHDPDIILVGEIRDRETADIAIRSSLTGHLVFATLHTNDAAGALPRLIDIGVEPYLVASSVVGVLAQRLVRKVCQHCKEPVSLDLLSPLERRIWQESSKDSDVRLWQGRGCESCRFTGYRNRMAVGEVLLMSGSIRQLVQQRQPSDCIREEAVRQGMRTLRQTAMLAVQQGKTSIGEFIRVTQEETVC